MGGDAEDDIPERQLKSSIKLVDLAQLSLDILAVSVSFWDVIPSFTPQMSCLIKIHRDDGMVTVDSVKTGSLPEEKPL